MLLLTTSLVGPACVDQGLSNQQQGRNTGPNITVEPATIDLGILAAGQQGSATLTVRNTGDTNLQLQDMDLLADSGGLTLVAPALPTTLAPGTSVQTLVTFDAVVTSVSSQVIVESDDPNRPLLDVPVIAGALLPELVIDPNPYDFGTVTPGADATGMVQLRNDGNVDLEIDRLLLAGDATSLSHPPDLPLTLGPSENLTLTMSFQPDSRASESALLWVGSNSWLGDTAGTVLGRGGWPGISGQICDPSGNGWVIDATVWADIDQDGDGETDWHTEADTDSSGHYELTDVPQGTWLIHVDKGSYSADFQAQVHDAGGITELATDTCLDPNSARVAVVSGDWDHIGRIIQDVGVSYDLYPGMSGLSQLLGDEEAGQADTTIDDYDVLFINCGDYSRDGESIAALSPRLLTWVQSGGSLYASDWAWQIIELSWPELADFYGQDTSFESPAIGQSSIVSASVVDPIMAYAIGGTTAEVLYDLDAWMVIAQAGTDTEVLFQADVPTSVGAISSSPLAVRAQPGGTVIYTTFHNERQVTADMEAALREIILSL